MNFIYYSSKGLYKKTLRTVVDIRDCMVLSCNRRTRLQETRKEFSVLGPRVSFFAVTSVSNLCWFTSQDTSQLTESRLALFPAILTYKYACNVAVVSFLRGWTLGNSPTVLRNAILEIHSEEWMRKQLRYLDDWRRYR